MSLLAMAVSAQMACLAQNVYFEARNQSYNGQLAVAQVVLNRVESDRFPDTICRVIKQGRTDSRGNMIRHQCHFSWYCDGLSDMPKNEEAWSQALMVAHEAMYLHESGHDITNGADHYHAKNVNPWWTDDMTYTMQIDDHLFYKD